MSPAIWAAALAALLPATLGAQEHVNAGSTVPHDSAAFAGAALVHLRNGLTRTDVIGDGSPGVVLVAVRENYNAHGYHAVAIAVRPRTPTPASPAWQLVTVDGGARGTGDTLDTEEGADCTLRDLRLLRRGRGRPLTLVIGQRALNTSYADPDSVVFAVYDLRFNAEGAAGWPAYYFTPTRVIRPTAPYCDVNVAFDRELGLGRGGIAPSEASASAQRLLDRAQVSRPHVPR